MNLEGLIEGLGGFGVYQIILTMTLASSKIVIVPTMLLMAFAGVEPDWWCTSRDMNLSQWNRSHMSGSYRNCSWEGTCDRKFSDAMVTAVSEWNLVCGLSWVSNAIISIQMIGVLTGCIIAGHCADKYGRKIVFYSGLLLLFLGNMVSAFSVSCTMFTALRAFLGMACGLVLATLYLYQVEFVTAKWRVFIAAVPDWQLAMVIFWLLTKCLHHWRWLHLGTAALAFPYLFTWLLMPESVRWLVVKGRLEEAKIVIRKIAELNNKPMPDTSILELIAQEEKAEGDKAKSYTYLDLFKTKELGLKTLITCFLWLTCSGLYYVVVFGLKNLSGDFYLNLLLTTLTEFPVTPCVLLIAVFRRRVGIAACLFVTAILCFGLAVSTRLAPAEEKGNYVNACALTAKFTISVGWIVAHTLGTEQFPTVIRNLAFGAQNSGGRIGAILAGQILSLSINSDLMLPYIALGVLVSLAGVATFGLEETSGKALEDTLHSSVWQTNEKGHLLQRGRSKDPCSPTFAQYVKGMHLETLIDDLGGFGAYQLILVPILALSTLVLAPTMLMMAFAGVEPDWWCASQDLQSRPWNMSYANESYQNCFWNGTCERKFSDSMETVVTEWNLVCQMSWISNAMISIQMVGVLVGTMIAGYCADAYGRKKVFYIGLLLIFVGNTASAFSVSWIMFTVLRAVLGIACSFILSTVYLYQIEFVGKKWRAFVSSLPSWPVSIMIFSLMAKWLHHWKWLHLSMAVLTVPILLTWFFVPESLRWLAVKGRVKEARRVIIKMAAYNKKPVPDTSILDLIAEEEKAEGNKANSYSYKDLLKTRKLTRKTIFSCYIWFSCSVVYYAISFGLKNLSGDFYLNMLLMALTELPVTPCIVLVTSLFGRRICGSVAFLLTAAGCFGLAISTRLAPEEDKGNYINACALMAKCATFLGWLVIQALCVEQYPTVIRNLGYAAMNCGARIGGILAGQVLTLGGNKDLMVPFIALGIIVFLTVLATLGLDETRGKALEDTMKTFTSGMTEQEKVLIVEEQPASTRPYDNQTGMHAEHTGD
ncbi:uncharacterized protein [Haliotis asinina]|uniref:uncharacterized protein n=1 Tax=Haliotis asinina TaxID=109174 RepID=UPI0035325AF3